MPGNHGRDGSRAMSVILRGCFEVMKLMIELCIQATSDGTKGVA